MIRFERITSSNDQLYNYMEQLITTSFPAEEYRPLDDLRKYTDIKTNFHNNIIFHQDTPVGFITFWDFGHFYYVEHFAIDPSQRNGGHGKNVLNHLFRILDHPIILEVEVPTEEMSERRINFYKRHGFELWDDCQYMQPPYRINDEFLPMILMAYGELSSHKDFEVIKGHIYREVYNVK